MHIPDGMISPTTAIVAGAAMVPAWWYSGTRLRQTLGTRQVPLLGVGAAFCFTIMMFNVPALGGTTAHAVGATLVAILLGPWAAVIAVTAALAIQALFFADGGLLSLGANSFTMAFVEPLVGYGVYRLLVGKSPTPGRTTLSSAAAAYAAIVAASVAVAVVLGIQPAFFHSADGHALYFPFGLKVTLAGIVPTHLLVAGPVEAVVTAVALRFAVANGIPTYGSSPESQVPRGKGWNRVVIAFLALLALSPLGLLASGEAWGEWDAAGVKARAGYVPKELEKAEKSGWKGVGALADYGAERGPLYYVLSGLLGVVALAGVTWVVAARWARRPEEPGRPGPPKGGGAGGGELPDWLAGSDSTAPPESGKTKRASRFLEKSVMEISAGAQTAVFSETFARRNGLLQRLDARLKVPAFAALIAVAGWTRSWAALGWLFAVSLLLVVASSLDIGAFLKRTWLTVPLWVGAIALPATLNVVTNGTPVLTLSHSPELSVTREGLAVAGLLTARVGLALSFALLLTLTTRWNVLLAALRALLVPRVFVVVLSLTYRYVELLLRSAREMLVARRSRLVGPGTNREGRRYVGGALGALFGRSLRLADDVHAAMTCRGFSGEIRTVSRPRFSVRDLALASVLVLVAAAAVALGKWS